MNDGKLFMKFLIEAGKLSAVIKVYGAWIDLTKRKLTIPPIEAENLFSNAVKSDDFEIIPLKKTD